MWHELAPYIFPLIALVFIIRRGLKASARKVRLGRLWVFPALILVAVIATLGSGPKPPVLILLAFAAALAVGGLVGFLRTHHMRFSVDSETQSVTQTATPLGTIIIAGLFVLRFGLKLVFPELNGSGGFAGAGGAGHHISTHVIYWTDGGLLFAAGMIWGRAVTTWVRAKAVLATHQVLNGQPPPANDM